MAQEPDFCLNLTDGDFSHTPTPAELRKGYTQADAISKLTALELLAKEVVKNVEDGEFEKGETENTVFALWCLLSQKLVGFYSRESNNPNRALSPYV